MLRYYFDEHVSAAISEQLFLRGIDVLTAQAARRAGRRIDDSEQLAYAASLDRTVVTEDRDFIRLAHTQLPHAGVILLQRPLSIGAYVAYYVAYLEYMAQATETDEVRNLLVYCDW